MKTFARTTQGILLLLIGAFLLIAGAASRFNGVTNENVVAAAFFAQSTVTPQVEEVSEIGSTDGIVMMGVIIMMIVVVPVLIRRKSWSKN